MAHPVSWFQITGRDGTALQDFYRSIFDWRMSSLPGGDMLMVAPEKDGIAGGVGSSLDGTSNVTVFASVDDLAAHLKRVQDAGGEIAMPPMELPGGEMGWIAGFTDPAGNWVGLWQPPAKPRIAKKSARKAAKKKAAPKAAKKTAKKAAKVMAKKGKKKKR